MVSCENSKIVSDIWENGSKVIRYYPDQKDTLNYSREYFYPNGQLGSKGQYKNGKMDAHWIWWHDNGNKMDEAFIDQGIYVKERKHWYRNGKLKLREIFANPCSDDCCDGEYLKYDSLGIIIQRSFVKDGQLNDSLFNYWENGNLFKITMYENDKKNGIYREFYQNGNEWVIGEYLHDSLHGKWEWYDSLRTLETIQNFENGILIEDEK